MLTVYLSSYARDNHFRSHYRESKLRSSKKKKKTISGLKRVSFSASDKFSSDNFQISFFKPVYLFLLDEKDQLSYLTVYIITFTFFSDSRIYEIIL